MITENFGLSSASSVSLLGGSLSLAVLTSIGFLGLRCVNVWGAQAAHESCSCGPVSGLETSDWKHFEARTRINIFIVVFYIRIAELQLLLEAFLQQNI